SAIDVRYGKKESNRTTLIVLHFTLGDHYHSGIDELLEVFRQVFELGSANRNKPPVAAPRVVVNLANNLDLSFEVLKVDCSNADLVFVSEPIGYTRQLLGHDEVLSLNVIGIQVHRLCETAGLDHVGVV